MYKITFKGDRQPETLEDEKGAKLYELRKTGKLKDQNVELRPGLLVPASSIKDIEFVRDSARREYTKYELEQFAAGELKEYLKEDGVLGPMGEILYYQSKGLLSFCGDTNDAYPSPTHIAINPDTTKAFGELQNKVQQYKYMMGARYAAQKHADREHEAMAPSREAKKPTPKVAIRFCECGCGADLDEASEIIGYRLTRFATSSCVQKARAEGKLEPASV